MYGDQDLTRLAAHKAALRQRIALQRIQCAEATTLALQPLAWLDRMLAFWRRLSPFAKIAAVPLGFLLKTSSAPPSRVLGALLRWGPIVLGTVNGLVRARRR